MLMCPKIPALPPNGSRTRGTAAAQAAESLPPIPPDPPSRGTLLPFPGKGVPCPFLPRSPSFHREDQTKALQRPVKETAGCLPCPGNLLTWQASGDTSP